MKKVKLKGIRKNVRGKEKTGSKKRDWGNDVPEKGSRGLSIKPMLARDLHKERKVTSRG